MTSISQKIKSMFTIKDDAHLKRTERLYLIVTGVGAVLFFLLLSLSLVIYANDFELSRTFAKLSGICFILSLAIPTLIFLIPMTLYRQREWKKGRRP